MNKQDIADWEYMNNGRKWHIQKLIRRAKNELEIIIKPRKKGRKVDAKREADMIARILHYENVLSNHTEEFEKNWEPIPLFVSGGKNE